MPEQVCHYTTGCCGVGTGWGRSGGAGRPSETADGLRDDDHPGAVGGRGRLAAPETIRSDLRRGQLTGASMEPGPCGPGDLQGSAPNGAPNPPQWSRGLAAPETRVGLYRRHVRVGASMEPGPCGPGDVVGVVCFRPVCSASMEPGPCGPGDVPALACPCSSSSPQWSRGLAAPETALIPAWTHRRNGPQWSRGLAAPETRTRRTS